MVARRQFRAGMAERRTPYGPAPPQHLFTDRKAEAGLLFMPETRQIGVEQVLGRFRVPGEEAFADADQHLRIGKARHGAVDATAQLLRQVKAAIADQDAEASAGPGVGASA